MLIGCSDILPALFETVFICTVVRDELLHPETPEIVRNWMENPPGWLEVRVAPAIDDPSSQPRDDGERAAIALALALKADLVLMDDRAGVAVARAKGFCGNWDAGIAGSRWSAQVAQAGRSLRTTQNNKLSLPTPEIMDALLGQAEPRKL